LVPEVHPVAFSLTVRHDNAEAERIRRPWRHREKRAIEMERVMTDRRKTPRNLPLGRSGLSTVLAVASTLNLLFSVVGFRKAVQEKIPYDIGFMKGSAEHIPRDQITLGSALSPPTIMMIAQAAGTAWMFKNPRPGAARLLGMLGLAMSIGFSMERVFHEPVQNPNRSTTPIVAGGESMAIVMAVLGFTLGRRKGLWK
jgi:hypothetical protein